MQGWRNRLWWVMLVRDERPGMSVHLQVRQHPNKVATSVPSPERPSIDYGTCGLNSKPSWRRFTIVSTEIRHYREFGSTRAFSHSSLGFFAPQ